MSKLFPSTKPSPDELKLMISKVSDEQLYAILHSRSGDYIPAALDAAREEAQKRNLDLSVSISESPQLVTNTSCICCGVEGPTKKVRFYQNIGMLITRQSKTFDGYLCRPCIGIYFRSYSLTTLFLGWWGVISMLVTPCFLISNVAQYIGARRLPDPGISALNRPVELTQQSAGSGSFKFKLVYGAIILCIGLGFLAYYHVEFMEKVAPGLNARLHKGEITEEADGEYVGTQIWKDIRALEADYKDKDWSGIRTEMLSREHYLIDLKTQNNKLQSRIQIERGANLGANDICEQLALDELGPALKIYTTAQDNLFSFAKNATELTPDNSTALQLLTVREESALQQLTKFISDNHSHGCDK